MKVSVKEIKQCACGAEIIVLRKRGSRNKCKKCLLRTISKAWRKAHPDRCRQLKRESDARNRETKRIRERARHAAHPERAAFRMANWTKSNPERAKQLQAEYRKRNHDKLLARYAERHYKKRLTLWSNKEEIAKIYANARILTKITGIEHEVDHIVPLKGKYVSGLHVEDNLRVILRYDNRAKSNRFPITAPNA